MKKKEAFLIANKFLKQVDKNSSLSTKKPNYSFIQRLFLKLISFFKDDSVYIYPPKLLTSKQFSQVEIKRTFTKDQIWEYNNFWAIIYGTDLLKKNEKYITPLLLNSGEGSFFIDKKTSLIYPMGISLVNEEFRSEIDKSYDTFLNHLNNSFPPSEGIDLNKF
jgi:hypothetical protein